MRLWRKLLKSKSILFKGCEEEIMKPYIESSIRYLINTKLHRSQQSESGNALYLRAITTLVVQVLTNAKLWKLLVNLFNQKDESIVTATDVLVFLLKLDDSDVIGEIVACQQLFGNVASFEGFDVELFDILNKSDTKRSFPKVFYFVYYLFLSKVVPKVLTSKMVLRFFESFPSFFINL